MGKKQVREEVLNLLQQFSCTPVEKVKMEAELYAKLFASRIWQEASTIGVTMNTVIELDTQPIITEAQRVGKNVAVPKVLGPGQMVFVQINTETKFEKSPFGIQEPVKNDIIDKNLLELIIVPGVAFRSDGYRVGFGGGFYDRYLQDYQGNTCSLVLPQQLRHKWEPTLFDIPVQQLFSITKYQKNGGQV